MKPEVNELNLETIVGGLLRTCQIITFALMSGCMLFLAMVLLLPGLGGQGQAGTEPILTWISVGGAVLMVLVGLVVPDLVGRQQVRRLRTAGTLPAYQGSPVPLPTGPAREGYIVASAYQTRLIIRLALLEGAAFFSLIAHMLERQWPSLLVAVVLLGLMAANFPTRGRLDHWMEEMANVEG